MLGGARPLDVERESEEVLIDCNGPHCKKNWQLTGPLPKTEIDMMEMVYDQMDLPSIEHIFVGTPLIPMTDGKTRNPATADIIQSWLNQKPQAGRYLFISTNPFVGYQDAAIRQCLPKEFTFETVGTAAHPDVKLSVHLDNLARWLYQESKLS